MLAVSKCTLTLAHKKNSSKDSFIVLELESVQILGFKTTKHWQLIKKINSEKLFSEFHDCFGEMTSLN